MKSLTLSSLGVLKRHAARIIVSCFESVRARLSPSHADTVSHAPCLSRVNRSTKTSPFHHNPLVRSRRLFTNRNILPSVGSLPSGICVISSS